MTSVGLVVTRGETGFGEGDREAAVGNVVGRLDDAFGSESNEAVDEALFGREVDCRRFTGNDGGDGFRGFGGGEFGGEIRRGEGRGAGGGGRKKKENSRFAPNFQSWSGDGEGNAAAGGGEG